MTGQLWHRAQFRSLVIRHGIFAIAQPVESELSGLFMGIRPGLLKITALHDLSIPFNVSEANDSMKRPAATGMCLSDWVSHWLEWEKFARFEVVVCCKLWAWSTNLDKFTLKTCGLSCLHPLGHKVWRSVGLLFPNMGQRCSVFRVSCKGTATERSSLLICAVSHSTFG